MESDAHRGEKSKYNIYANGFCEESGERSWRAGGPFKESIDPEGGSCEESHAWNHLKKGLRIK